MKMGDSWGRLFFCSHASYSMEMCQNLIMMTPSITFHPLCGFGGGYTTRPYIGVMKEKEKEKK